MLRTETRFQRFFSYKALKDYKRSRASKDLPVIGVVVQLGLGTPASRVLNYHPGELCPRFVECMVNRAQSGGEAGTGLVPVGLLHKSPVQIRPTPPLNRPPAPLYISEFLLYSRSAHVLLSVRVGREARKTRARACHVCI